MSFTQIHTIQIKYFFKATTLYPGGIRSHDPQNNALKISKHCDVFRTAAVCLFLRPVFLATSSRMAHQKRQKLGRFF
jgi:hypothetical protein